MSHQSSAKHREAVNAHHVVLLKPVSRVRRAANLREFSGMVKRSHHRACQ
jgi:hypothetical protein